LAIHGVCYRWCCCGAGGQRVMEMMVLCRCGHPSGLHSENGCRAGRYQPCICRLDAPGAIESAVLTVRTPSWREKFSESNPHAMRKELRPKGLASSRPMPQVLQCLKATRRSNPPADCLCRVRVERSRDRYSVFFRIYDCLCLDETEAIEVRTSSSSRMALIEPPHCSQFQPALSIAR
jgi:hypothetical protein